MKVFSLFSGIGGFDLATERAGHEVVGGCEINKYARQIYSNHFPTVRIWKDATEINPEELPDFDMLCAGFPCQTFSIAGNRLGFEESRGTLFFEIARIIKQKRPRLLLLENVKGLLSHDRGKTFAVILATLDELGYDAEWQVLNSKYFVPQNRERIFIVGHLRGESSRQVFPLGESSARNNGEENIKSSIPRTRQYSTAIDSSYYKGPDGKRTVIAVSIENTKANGRRIKDEGDPQFCLSQNCGVGILNNQRIRRLTPLECERLQGFPDNWTEGLSDTQRYKCCGNAVTVPVVEYILTHLSERN